MLTIRLSYVLRKCSCLLLAALIAVPSALAAPTDDVYTLGPDSQPHEGVPRGKVIGPLTLASQIFPNTTRHYWVYVPAQYDPKQPAALMIFQDGQAFVGPTGEYRIPCVFDNLIYRREMPVTLAVFINPGHLPDQPESSSTNWGDGINNRVTEYNELNDNYAKLILDELLPALEKDYSLSKIRMIAPSAARVPGRSALSLSRGSAPTSSTKSSAPLAASRTSAADTSIPI
jgi:enterochelin esterase family protein